MLVYSLKYFQRKVEEEEDVEERVTPGENQGLEVLVDRHSDRLVLVLMERHLSPLFHIFTILLELGGKIVIQYMGGCDWFSSKLHEALKIQHHQCSGSVMGLSLHWSLDSR